MVTCTCCGSNELIKLRALGAGAVLSIMMDTSSMQAPLAEDTEMEIWNSFRRATEPWVIETPGLASAAVPGSDEPEPAERKEDDQDRPNKFPRPDGKGGSRQGQDDTANQRRGNGGNGGSGPRQKRVADRRNDWSWGQSTWGGGRWP